MLAKLYIISVYGRLVVHEQIQSYIIVASNVLSCRVNNKISSKSQGFLVKRSCKCPIYAHQGSFGMAKLWDSLNVNTPQERISWRLSKEKSDLQRSVDTFLVGSQREKHILTK